MSDINKIEGVLVKMIGLLRPNNTSNWADVLEKCCQELSENPVVTKNKILSMYGGMGSLNDIVLYKSGQPLSKENTEFDDLRSDLYDLCRALE